MSNISTKMDMSSKRVHFYPEILFHILPGSLTPSFGRLRLARRVVCEYHPCSPQNMYSKVVHP